MKNLKEKLAVLVAVQQTLVEITGDARTTDEEFAAVGKLLAQEFPPNEHTQGKSDGEPLLEVLRSLQDTLTAELVAAAEVL